MRIRTLLEKKLQTKEEIYNELNMRMKTEKNKELLLEIEAKMDVLIEEKIQLWKLIESMKWENRDSSIAV